MLVVPVLVVVPVPVVVLAIDSFVVDSSAAYSSAVLEPELALELVAC